MQTKYASKTAVTPGHEAGHEGGKSEANRKSAGAFGLSFAIAVLITAALFAFKAFNPELEEWAEEAFGHAWFYQAVLALILFFGLGLIPMGGRLGGRGAAAIVAGSTVVSGLVILVAAAMIDGAGVGARRHSGAAGRQRR